MTEFAGAPLRRPRVVLTTGDPAGIGPEIAIAAAGDPRVRAATDLLVVGDIPHLRRIARLVDKPLPLRDVRSGDAPTEDERVDVWHVPSCDPDLQMGVASAAAGRAAFAYIEEGATLCGDGRGDVLVTAPINKYAFSLAGLGHEGHTELLARLTGAPWSLTLFLVENVRVLFLSRHISLRDAIDAVTTDGIVTALARFSTRAWQLGLEKPRIAVAALNPHAGEEGLFGTEEAERIVPAIRRAREAGLDVTGPIPADAVFAQAREGRYDVVLALYHDQAAVPCKAIDFHGTVSLTLGLPFLRFSVDHGTAFDIAGQGRANAANMTNAVLAAARSAAHPELQTPLPVQTPSDR